jgi:two-component system NtrC family sensor kinase
MRKMILVCTLLLSGLFIRADNAGPILFKDPSSLLEIGGDIQILEDSRDTLSVQQALISPNYKASTQKVPNRNLSSSAFWLKMEITNFSQANTLLLMLSQPIMDEVTLYHQEADGHFSMRKMGECQPFSKREINDPDFIFRLYLAYGKTGTYLMKIKSSDQLQFPLVVGTETIVFEHISTKNLLSGLYLGIMLVMIFYNLFIFFSVRDKSYLYYVAYIALIILTQTGLQGYPFQYLWPNWPWMAIHADIFSPSLVGVASLAFLQVFLRTKEYTPKLYKLNFVFYGVYAINMTLAFLNVYKLSFTLMELNAMLVSIYIFIVALILVLRGYRPARFFLLAWTSFLVGVCVFILKDFGVFPFNDFTRYTMQAGSAFEVILISFALADRINIFKREKEESQAQVLFALRENERIITEQNVILESRVNERTAELSEANDELSKTFNHLKATQSQLVDAEKMASLGQLTAGIAHEINNPINFVKSNIKSIKRNVDELKTVLEKYTALKPGEKLEDKLRQAHAFSAELDTDYSMNEIDELVHGIDDGATRTAEIIKGLRTFSRLGEDDLKKSNVHEGLDSTLVLLNSQTKDKISIEKKYSAIQEIDCYAGTLNQVFMNILNNAIQAVAEHHPSDREGHIIISTSQNSEEVIISIKDNGAGMSPEVQKKIFEPFFTTKAVGKGIGLGLSIAYKIIEKHRGKITVKSEPGKGSEFTICLRKTL